MFEVIPLGTGAAVPTRHRNLSACALRREGRVYLFDCGEGTQFRLLQADLNRARIDAVFITHVHGDHLYGLPGMITTMALLERKDPLTVVGPTGIEAIVRGIPGLARDWIPFAIRWVELPEGFTHQVVYETDEVMVEARPIEHRIFCAGYRFEEKPRPGSIDGDGARAAGVTEGWQFEALKRRESVTLADGSVLAPDGLVGPERPGGTFAYVLDTTPCEGGRLLARDADLLLHEATFDSSLEETALETGHTTARQAAHVARDANAKRLLLTHFSARYTDTAPLVAEARTVFPETEAAEELKRYTVVAPAVFREAP